MEAILCRQLNYMSLERLAEYLCRDYEDIKILYDELLEDSEFLCTINKQLKSVRRFYTEGLFSHVSFDSIDWFAIQRIVLYVLVRLFQPSLCVETGVFYGGSTCFILQALNKNNSGHLISIDLPADKIADENRHYQVGQSELIPQGLSTGFLIPDSLKQRWQLMESNSLESIPRINQEIDLYMHDSEHTFDFIQQEMSLVWPRLSENAVIIADDIDWSNGFYAFCVNKKLFPFILSDNGKSGLRARTGIAWLNQPKRKKQHVTGS